jgi:hypothetical protein
MPVFVASALAYIQAMASPSKLVTPGCYWKHMKWRKRLFWKKERRVYVREIRRESDKTCA